jgi:hypothetical protein
MDATSSRAHAGNSESGALPPSLLFECRAGKRPVFQYRSEWTNLVIDRSSQATLREDAHTLVCHVI